ALFVQHGPSGGHALLEIDLVKGSARHLYPAGGRSVTIATAAYAMDDRRVFIATDGGNERSSLLALDLASLATLAEHKEAVGAVVPSPRGDRIAIGVDAGNHSFVRLLDAATLTPVRDVTTPRGSVSLG